MRVILIGHPASQFLVPASKYLLQKYLPDFNITFLNYTGEIHGWSKYLADYLLRVSYDNYVIVALDDYLVNAPIDTEIFNKARKEVRGDIICAKLCETSQIEHEEYPATTQFCIWNRHELIKILYQTSNPWDFETRGSRIMNETKKESVMGYPAISYDVHSALTENPARWKGINWNGVNQEDRTWIKTNLFL